MKLSVNEAKSAVGKNSIPRLNGVFGVTFGSNGVAEDTGLSPLSIRIGNRKLEK